MALWMAKSAKPDISRMRDERLVIPDTAIQTALNKNALMIKELHHLVETHKRKLMAPTENDKEITDRFTYLQDYSKKILTTLADLADTGSA